MKNSSGLGAEQGGERGSPDQRILIVAPTGNDARLTADFLAAAGLEPVVCPDIQEMLRRGANCGALLLAEEALGAGVLPQITDFLSRQPSWSDLPVAIITRAGNAALDHRQYLSAFGERGNVTLIERPFRPGTLVSTLEVALRSRRRQYQVRDLLQQSLEGKLQLEYVLAAGGLGTWTYDVPTGVLATSDLLRTIFGLAQGASLTLAEKVAMVIPEDRDAMQRAFETSIRTGIEYHAQYRICTPAGEIRWIASRGRTTSDGNKVRQQLAGVSQNITLQKELEEQLSDSQARLRFALDSAKVGDWDLDIATDCAQRSLRHDQAFGYHEPVAKWGFEKFIQHVHPDDRASVTQQFRAALAGNHDWRFECRVIWPDGSVHWIAAHGSMYEARESPRMLGIVFEITERKLAEEAIATQANALRVADRRKDEFLAMLAHELRNPLAAVTNAITLLKSSRDKESQDWAAGVVERQSGQLARLIDDLLDVSRINTGKVRLKTELVNAAIVLDRACDSVVPLIEERKHHLARAYEHNSLWLDADPTRLEQVVVNLLSNAAKYTPSGGRIDLEARREGREIVIAVRDTGLGIRPERLVEMFELFAQGERSIARSEGGLGVGLTIARKLAEMHGGSVEAFSEGADRGSTFTVRLPAAAAPASVSASAVQSAALQRSLRMLVVDDNRDAADVLARLLRRDGHEVVVARDGHAALASARSTPPDVVLLDIGLPGMDGYEVAQRLRQEPQGRRTLILAVSGYGQEEDRRRALDAGFDLHLVKPLDFSLLRELLLKEGQKAPRE